MWRDVALVWPLITYRLPDYNDEPRTRRRCAPGHGGDSTKDYLRDHAEAVAAYVGAPGFAGGRVAARPSLPAPSGSPKGTRPLIHELQAMMPINSFMAVPLPMKRDFIRTRTVPVSRCFLLAVLLLPSQAEQPRDATAKPVSWTSGDMWEMPPLFVTTQRSVADPIDVPYAADVVGAKELERTQPRSTTEALRELPSIMVQKTGHAQGSPFIRGFTGFRNLMLVDGIRLNNSTFREGPNQYWTLVDSYAVDRLEVVRGPGSMLYGSDAIGGTVNALSKSRQEYGAGFGWDARTLYRFSSAENSHIGRAEFEGHSGEHFGFNVGASFKNFGDLRGGEDIGEMPQTGYGETAGDARLAWRINDQSELVYGHQTVVQDDSWRTHSTIYGISWEGTTLGTDLERILDQNRNLDYLQYRIRDLEGFVEEIEASVSYQAMDERETRLRPNRRRDRQGVDVDTFGTLLRLHSPTTVGRWLYGVDYYRDSVDSFFADYNPDGSFRSARLQGPVADDSNYDLFGAYVEDMIPLANDRLKLSFGGRYNLASASVGRAQDPVTGAPLSFDETWDSVVGSGRILWHVDEERAWTLFGGVSQGFRAPNLSDLSRFDIARSGEQEVPAFGLEPEDFVSVEGGVKVKKGRLGVEAAYYRTYISEMIVRTPTGTTLNGAQVVTKSNSGDGHIQGVELAAQVDLYAGFLVWGNFTWMEGILETPTAVGGPLRTEPVSRLMPTTVNYGLRWEHESHRYWAEFAGTVAGTQDKLSSGDVLDTQRIPPGGTPGYEVFHLRAGWRPCENFSLTAALENLSDADYRIHGSGLNEPGRNFVMTLDVRF